MPENQFTLYVDSKFVSPYAMSAFVALQEKALPFAIKCLDLSARESFTTKYAEVSLTCRVPTLAHGVFSVSESSAISEYLEEMFPRPQYTALYPLNIQERARARQLQAWLRSDLMSIRQERTTEVIFCKPTRKPLSQEAISDAKMLFAATDALLKNGTENLFGEWCIADTDVALMLNRLVLNGDAVPDNLAAYAQHQWQRSSVQQWIKLGRKTWRTSKL